MSGLVHLNFWPVRLVTSQHEHSLKHTLWRTAIIVIPVNCEGSSGFPSVHSIDHFLSGDGKAFTLLSLFSVSVREIGFSLMFACQWGAKRKSKSCANGAIKSFCFQWNERTSSWAVCRSSSLISQSQFHIPSQMLNRYLVPFSPKNNTLMLKRFGYHRNCLNLAWIQWKDT